MSGYCIEFEIPGLPPTINAGGRSRHWRIGWAATAKWKESIGWATAGKRPKKPLERAQITLTRYSSMEPDFDGLVSSFKAVIDGLVVHGVLAGDKMSQIGQPRYRWEKCPRNSGKIKVRVEEVPSAKA